MENVYDVVDVDQYSEMVTNRVNDDWIVDDDGSVTLNLFIRNYKFIIRSKLKANSRTSHKVLFDMINYSTLRMDEKYLTMKWGMNLKAIGHIQVGFRL